MTNGREETKPTHRRHSVKPGRVATPLGQTSVSGARFPFALLNKKRFVALFLYRVSRLNSFF